MRKGDPLDPLFLQVWPTSLEAEPVPGFVRDAVGDGAAAVGDGVIHKYQGRALLITTGACAVHCRYCFRRHYPYAEDHAARGRWEPALARLAADPSIGEVILSGGDPLSLSDERLAELFAGLGRIPHLRRLRIHTRQPVVLPERVDAGLLKLLADLPLQKVMVIHANHANELDGQVGEALTALRRTGLTLLNQSVLLSGINDTLEALSALHERLFAFAVLPYYLHVMDRVEGAAHFEVPEARAAQLMQQLSACSPGYLMPRLAREVPGEPAKTWLRW
jgi:EF-P beta-lysylation protein EpmB